MTTPTLTFAVDTIEQRVQIDRLAVLTTGAKNDILQWDLDASSNIFVDPVTATAFLTPLPATAGWDTTFTGGYRRFHASDYTLTTPDDWVEHNYPAQGSVYLYSLDSNEIVPTRRSFPVNQGWWFSFFAFGQGDTFLQLEITWGNVVCDIYSDGTVVFGKNGLVFGSGNLTQLENGGSASRKQRKKSDGASQGLVAGLPVSFMVIPCRNREILFLTNRGGGFHVVFPDIDKSDPHPVILPAGTMQWQVPNGQAMVSCAPLAYLSSGYALTLPQTLRQAPSAGAVATCLSYADAPGYGGATTAAASFRLPDGATAFVGNNTRTDGRLRVDLAGDGTNTPWVYGASAVFPATFAATDGLHTLSLDAVTLEASLVVPENPSGVTLTATLNQTDAIDALLPGSQRLGNRPCLAKVGNVTLFSGRTGHPKLIDGPVDAGRKLILECRDAWKGLERYQILDPLPYDGRRLTDVIKELAMLTGATIGEMDVEEFDLVLDSQGQASEGEWALIPEAGDTAAKWIEQLHDDFAKTAIVGWYPVAGGSGRKFRFRTPESIGTTPDVTLYMTRADALAAGYSEAEHWKHVVRSYEQDALEAEANDIRVTGWDSRLDKAFQTHYADTASQDPTLVPAARPANWQGEPVRYSLFDPAITDQATAEYVNAVLVDRLTNSRITAEIECEAQFKADGSPLWRGNVLAIAGRGSFRVLTLNIDPQAEHSADALVPGDVDALWRPARYTVEYIPGT